ncbi:MAG: hypothetical protein ACK56I_04575, partial [bacterium]
IVGFAEKSCLAPLTRHGLLDDAGLLPHPGGADRPILGQRIVRIDCRERAPREVERGGFPRGFVAVALRGEEQTRDHHAVLMAEPCVRLRSRDG